MTKLTLNCIFKSIKKCIAEEISQITYLLQSNFCIILSFAYISREIYNHFVKKKMRRFLIVSTIHDPRSLGLLLPLGRRADAGKIIQQETPNLRAPRIRAP